MFVWLFGIFAGGYHYALKMFVFEKVRLSLGWFGLVRSGYQYALKFFILEKKKDF